MRKLEVAETSSFKEAWVAVQHAAAPVSDRGEKE
jgi:hypothetical protein